MSCTKELLENYRVNGIKVFIRPRDIRNLKDLLKMDNLQISYQLI